MPPDNSGSLIARVISHAWLVLLLSASAALFAFPLSTEAAVAFDAVGPSSAGAGGHPPANPLTWSHTTSGNNRLLVVGLAFGIEGGGNSPTVSVTYDDVPMTSFGRFHVISGDDDSDTNGFVEMFYLAAPSIGPNTVSVTFDSVNGTMEAEAGSISFTGVSQSSPIAHSNTNRGNGTSASVSVTSAVGNMVVDLLGAGGNPIGSPGAGIDARWEKNIDSQSAAGNGAQSTDDGAASVTMSYSTSNDVWGIIALDLAAAPATRSTLLKPPNNLGYSMEETASRIKSKSGRTIASSTLANWLHQHRELISYLRLRERGRRRFPPEQTIRSIKLYHRQIYRYAFHRPKLEFLRHGELDEKRGGDVRFAPIVNFLEAVPLICPHDLFRAEDRGRASQAQPAFADVSRIIVNKKENVATRIAALTIPGVGNNKLRHETLQRFMLLNDSVTLAIEIPIWLTEHDIEALEQEHGIELAPRVGAAERTITGHIDFLQVRNGAVHILDYKPDARTNKPIAQLAIYALALTRLVPGLRLFDIKCAWFNEEEYCEFFPRTLFARRPAQQRGDA